MGIVERLRKLKWMLNCEVRGMIPDTTAYEAADHIEALEASVVGLTQERDFHRETADIHAERIARAADLIERLKGYAVHDENCEDGWLTMGGEKRPCTCGLTALIKESNHE